MDKLNTNQYKAATDESNNILVLAGAGTGKTRVLINRIINLIDKGVEPRNILAFTFTNKAANEMRYRISKSNRNVDGITISTFHSYCFSYLVDFSEYIGYQKGFGIIDDNEKLKIIKKIIADNNLKILDKTVIKFISNIKNHTNQNYENINEAMITNFVFYEYQKILLQNQKMDLDDLLYYFHKLLKLYEPLKEIIQQTSKYILVDEFQDTNVIQFEILELLSGVHNNLFMVGDQDQCIYTFRGSNLNNIEDFIEKKNPKIIKLQTNYRSNKNILNVANDLIKSNVKRIDKNLYPTQYAKDYQVIYSELASDYDESIYIANLILKLKEKNYEYDDICILYRNHSISSNIERELLKAKVPYNLIGRNRFFEHKEIKTIINYFYFLQNKDDISLYEIFNFPNRKIGEVTFSSLEEQSKNENKTIYEVMKESSNENIKKFVDLIETLDLKFSEEQPYDFMKTLLEELEYESFITKQENAKEKLQRIYEFKNMFINIELKNDLRLSTIEFLNQIYLHEEDGDEAKSVNLMTIHQAKGLEFKVIIIAGCNEGILPSYKASTNDLEEERRIFYVAITRARERLYLLSARQRTLFGKKRIFKPSPFLSDINLDLMFIDVQNF